MDPLSDTSSLLGEQSIISEEEKKEITERIDREFSSNFEIKSDLYSLSSARSKGLLLPLLISIGSVGITVLLLFIISQAQVFQEDRVAAERIQSIEQVEWALLQEYMEESNRELATKNREISTYRNQLKIYDDRLNTLRELIRAKREIEDELADEESRLEAEGLGSANIATRLSKLEDDLVAGLTPGITDNWNLSIEELNNKIDQVLEKRTESEEKLIASIAEKEAIELQNRELREELQRRPEGTALDPEESARIAALEEAETRREQDRLFDNYLNELYQQIYQRLAGESYPQALQLIEDLAKTIDSRLLSEQDADRRTDLNREVENLNFLADYAESAPTVESNVINELLLSLQQLNLEDPETLDAAELAGAEETLRTSLSTVPEISRALEVLLRIQDERLLSRYDSVLADFQRQLSASAVTQPASEGDLLLLGSISDITFNRIAIQPEDGAAVRIGTSFSIYRTDSSGAKTELGRGIITDTTGNTIRGRLESLINTSMIPEVNDSIYIQR